MRTKLSRTDCGVREEIENIYASGLWGRGSGEGSQSGYSRRYVEVLSNILRQYSIKTVLDLGCGDWSQGFSRHLDWAGIDYTGIDVVRSVVEKNQKDFGTEKIVFRAANILADELPIADLIILKDVLQHWSNASVSGFLPKLKAFKYALVTNDLVSTVPGSLNQDTRDGGFRAIDIMAPPFRVAGTEIMIYSNCTYRPEEPLRWLKKMILVLNERP